MNNFLKSQQEIDEYMNKLLVKNIDIKQDKISISDIHDEFDIIYKIVKNYKKGFNHIFISVPNILSSYKDKADIENNIIPELLQRKREVSTINDYIEDGELITSYLTELHFDDIMECSKYYICDYIIKRYNDLQNMGLTVSNIIFDDINIFHSGIVYVIEFSQNSYDIFIKKKLEEYKSYIPGITSKTYLKAKEDVVYALDYLSDIQGKNGKDVIIDEFGDISFDLYRYMVFILMLENYVYINKYNTSDTILVIDLLKPIEDFYFSKSKDGSIALLNEKKGLDKLHEFLADKKCKEIQIKKDKKGKIKFIIATRIVKGKKHIDIQEQYPYAMIKTRTFKGRANTYIVEQRIKISG